MLLNGTASAISGFILVIVFAIEAHAGADGAAFDANACVHWVKPGENLVDIAQSYGLAVEELIHLNQVDNDNSLFAGQAIILPSSLADCQPPNVAIQENIPVLSPLAPLPQPAIDYNYVAAQPEDTEKKKYQEKLAESKDDHICGEGTLLTDNSVSNTQVWQKNVDPVSPAQEAFGERPYAYYGSSESLTDVLQNFAASYYIPLILQENIAGEVNGKIGPLAPVDFLEHMSNVYGFIWYFDGHTLYVYNADSAQQQILSLNYMNADSLQNTLKKVGVWDKRFFWNSQPKEGLVYISGPPRYVELVTQTANLLDEKEGMRQKSKLTVCTFKLKYAWATDKSYSFRGNQITVPGVTTLLKNIVAGGGVTRQSPTETNIPSVKPVTSVSRSLKGAANDKKEAINMPKSGLNSGAKAEAVFINADPRQNAVIVHDLESKMSMYSELVKSLDKPTAQIEISVSIIDVSTSRLEALGVSFGNSRPSERSEISFNPLDAAQNFPKFSTVLSANIGSFNATLSMLANQGDARLISKPSILTLDNLEAVLDSTNTSYVKVEANQDAQLFPVISGTVVQVTPRIVEEKESRKIHMSISIQDGKDTSEKGQSVPSISNSTLNTQAVVHENESLLLGGFYREEETTISTKVPVLGDIPILGTLFRADAEDKKRNVRIFLITPRIIELKRT
ncbi:MAG: type III secretion system outer membrane ring subunit SctC [Endozoicomonas sp. (ex Botrylloides leachii)]|nr:type III secretion system outer membrane ring subunit SctC [Endozoicomonas sp. (ex Botrylloides leachii)]